MKRFGTRSRTWASNAMRPSWRGSRGRSPTILRRRLSRIDAIRRPQWASDRETARSLVPLTLAGVWHAKSSADCKVLSELTGCAYEAVEENITHLRQLDDPPVWSVGQYRGVASQIDALFAISPHMIEKDIDRFLESAKTVLSECDPALEAAGGSALGRLSSFLYTVNNPSKTTKTVLRCAP